jgi:hypothetical protein
MTENLMTLNKKLNAAHEVGHFLLSRHYGITTASISIMEGRDETPIIRYEEGIMARGNVDVVLAGWAAEAYAKTHNSEDEAFKRSRLIAKLFTSGCGAGWPFGLVIRRKNDINDLLAAGAPALQLVLPMRELVKISNSLHNERDLFWRLVEKLKEKNFLGAPALQVLINNEKWTAAVESENEHLKMLALAPASMRHLIALSGDTAPAKPAP